VTVPPAVKTPQSMELRGVVHALSEYKPQFADVVTAPFESTFDFDDRLLATFGDCVAGLLDTFGNVFTISAEDGIGELVMTAKVVTDKPVLSPLMQELPRLFLIVFVLNLPRDLFSESSVLTLFP